MADIARIEHWDKMPVLPIIMKTAINRVYFTGVEMFKKMITSNSDCLFKSISHFLPIIWKLIID